MRFRRQRPPAGLRARPRRRVSGAYLSDVGNELPALARLAAANAPHRVVAEEERRRQDAARAFHGTSCDRASDNAHDAWTPGEVDVRRLVSVAVALPVALLVVLGAGLRWPGGLTSTRPGDLARDLALDLALAAAFVGVAAVARSELVSETSDC